MKKAKKLLSVILAVLLLSGAFPISVLADFTFSIVIMDEVYLYAPTPVGNTEYQYSSSDASVSLKRGGSVAHKGDYIVKSFNWYKDGTSTKASSFTAGQSYRGEVVLRCLDDGFFDIHELSSQCFYVMGIPDATSKSFSLQSNNKELLLTFCCTAMDEQDSPKFLVNGSVKGLGVQTRVSSYTESYIEYTFTKPQTAATYGYTYYVDYSEGYCKKDKSDPYFTWKNTYDEDDLTDNGDGTFTLRVGAINDIHERTVDITAKVYLVSPEGGGVKSYCGTYTSSLIFTQSYNNNFILKVRGANYGTEHSVQFSDTQSGSSHEIEYDPYIYSSLSFIWDRPLDMSTHNSTRNGVGNGTVIYKARAYLDGEEVSFTNTYGKAGEYSFRVTSVLDEPIYGTPGEKKTLEIELFAHYPEMNPEGKSDSEVLYTCSLDLLFNEQFEKELALTGDVTANGNVIPWDSNGKKTTVQSYLSNSAAFYFDWLNDSNFYGNVNNTNGIYKKNQGDLRIELVGNSMLPLTADSAVFGIYCNNDLLITGDGTLDVLIYNTDGEVASNSRGIYLVGGSMTLSGATVNITAGKGIEVAGISQSITTEALVIKDTDGITEKKIQPYLSISALSYCLTIFNDTVVDIRSGTFDFETLYTYGKTPSVANIDNMQLLMAGYSW